MYTNILNHDSPASIRVFLKEREIAPRKRWGQNFLINRGARHKIVNLLEASDKLHVWEIGPGLGAMSEIILDAGMDLTVFEIDPAYCRWLEESLGPRGVRIVAGDVLKNWKGGWASWKPDRVLGNLPYNLASTIIGAFIENESVADVCVFTVQDEMGRRILAEPGGKNYSSFSILCQTGSVVKDGGALAAGSFYPAPRVQSRIIRMKPARPYGHIHAPQQFRFIVRSLFASRRKTLGNNLSRASHLPSFPDIDRIRDAFSTMGIDLSRRPETVSPGEWVAVANEVAGS